MKLYELEGCPYCKKVKDALAAKGIEYESIMVDSLKPKREDVFAVSGQFGVPVLVDENDVVIVESGAIVEYINER